MAQGPVGPFGPLVDLRRPRTLRHLGPLCRPSASWPYRPCWPGAPPPLHILRRLKPPQTPPYSIIGSRSLPGLGSGIPRSGIWIWNPDLESRSGIQIWHPDLESRSGIQIWSPDLKSRSEIQIWNPNIGFSIGFRGTLALEAEGRLNGGLGPREKTKFFSSRERRT